MEVENDSIKSELFFLIAKFLKDSQFKNAFEALKSDLNESNILPTRIDFLGQDNQQTFDEMERKYDHIRSDHLLEICKRIRLLSNYEKSPVPVVFSLLGKGSFSLVNTQKKRKYLSLSDCITRQHNALPLPPTHIRGHNIVKMLIGRETSGSVDKRYLLPVSKFSNAEFHGRVLGHLTAVYCVCFDTSGRFIATGADDYLVKLWEANTGRLLSTLRGASAEITDIAINTQATLIAAGSMDKVLRVWCLQTSRPIAHVVAHASMIVTVNFCPQTFSGLGYIASTSTDGSVVFWPFRSSNGNTTFEPNLTVYNERMRPGSAKILCGAFSAGGVMFATGSADHNVRVYKMTPPTPDASSPVRLMEVEAHSDTVDSIQWAHSGLRFSSGSKDGTALIWSYKNQEWKFKTLHMTTKLKKNLGEKKSDEELKQIKPSVTYLCWDQSDRWILTACTDMTIKVWDSYTTELLQVMIGHKKEVYVLESHPFHSKILLSAGHDGKIFLWNIITGEVLVSFQNSIEGQGFAALFDAKWSPDGTMFAVTDSQGHLLTYGLGIPPPRRKVPYEVFFHTDYRPLLRAADHSVLDEQTNMDPHLMPPPFLVDSDGSPYPPEIQRLVPGKENEGLLQLVADVIINELGRTEVIGIRGTANMNTVEHLSNNSPNQSRVISLHPSVEQSGSSFSFENRPRIICKPLTPSIMDQIQNRIKMLETMEEEEFTIESEKPIIVDEKPQVLSIKPRKRPQAKHSYSTRATIVENDLQENRSSSNSDESESEDADYTDGIDSDGKSSSDTDSGTSSEYSDWVADSGTNLEPPKRTQHRRRRVKRPTTPPSSPSPPSSPQEGPKTVPPRKVKKDVPEIYRPSEWFSEVLPKKSPYCPQMGDILMFFEQGYNLYLEAVETKKVYKLRKSQCAPWGELELKEPQMVKVIGIKYEIRPPRLCGLRLAVLKENGDHTSFSFDLKYHDMQDVIDFLVLRQTYEAGLARKWKEGQRFRSMIDNAWWCGKIVEQNSSRSPFLCYKVLWDNDENENLSPWDMEPVNPKREPLNGMSLPVTTKEMKDILYQPESGNKEWPSGSRDLICDRILRGLHDLMGMSLAEPFLAPVDIQEYPSYAYIVEYPIDLSIIKARLENRFYRRLAAVQFDARYIASNAEKFNEEGSDIVISARVITEILLTIIKSPTPIEVPSLCRQLQQTYKNNEREGKKSVPSEKRLHKLRPGSLRDRSQLFNWKLECKKFLQMLWLSKDSTPFREPIDYNAYPDYGRVVNTPMDLTSIREDLRGDNYNTPEEFCEDVRRVFNNAKIYSEVHPDKKLELMTRKMINLSEENISQILHSWTRSLRRPTSIVSHLSSRPQRRCRLKRQRDMDNSQSEDDSDADFNLRSKKPRRSRTIINEVTTEESSDEEEIKFDPNQPSTSFAHNERNGSKRIKRKKSINMPSTSVEIKEEVQSNDETPLRRHSSRICKPTYRLQDNYDDSEDDDNAIESQRPKRLVKQPSQDYDNDSDDEVLPTKPSRSRRFPMREERYEVPPITSRNQASRFYDGEEEQPTRVKKTRSRFLKNEETDQRGARNLRKKKRWNYAKMLDVSGISSEEGADDWIPTEKFTKKDARHKSRDLRKTKKRNYSEDSDHSCNDNSDKNDDGDDDDDDDDDDDNDEENSVNIRVSVSSRGRIRKLTAEAKAHLFRR
ncbi:Six-bladed beta-propeller, TolB-like,WD40-repeat-containing domain,Bromodomain,WD40 repeat, conserved [Cinara cedri]|uniref:Six-bladed beta-propeller, TolB-like,WD40-repeat-containing domain,Bromodomain,WD40 repeat, conserved n=1 Tax=Cinara cedri TaxID=506608 RepID=A0A5E4MDE3_9HEMI|nr:Six-bladed beta-propeller, TolB-like,WD40-repeat-containing domain,Bromodomain,WD40 repeat, conserved [Cinara cedri]